jgi:hypothetical protein
MNIPEGTKPQALEPGGQPNLWPRRLVLIGAGLAVALASFEVRTPLVTVGPVSFTTSEVAALLFFAAAAWWMATDWRGAVSRRVLDLPVAVFLLSNFLSTAVAADKADALKFSLRMTFAALLYLGISRLPARSRSHLVVAGALTGSLLVVTVVGLLENFVSAVDWPYLLSPWQEVISTFGTYYNLRVASTLPFPTVLSMFLELAFPLALAFGIWFTTRKSARRPEGRLLSPILLIALSGIMAVQVLTYTRSAIVATPLSLLAGASLAWVYGYGRRVVVYFLVGAAMLVLFLGASVVFSNKMATRLGVAEQEKTYAAEYQLLSFPDSITPGNGYSARVRVTNSSDVMWYAEGSDRIFMVYRWLDYPERSDPDFEYINTNLPRDVAPGDTIDMDIKFATPAGARRYVLVIELVKYSVGWFSDAGESPLFIPLDLTKTSAQRFDVPETAESFIAAKPIEISATRTQLWKAAVRMWKEHPVLGVGPGQFRKVYPQYLPEIRPDQRLESHNIFLEAAANTGTLGLVAMVFLLAAAAWTQLKLARSTRTPFTYRLLALALICAMVAYVVHGVLDFFLWQTGIAFTFFAELGLTAWLAKTCGREDAG